MLKAAGRKEELSSDDLAERTGLARGTVVHHLNNLMAAGLVETYRSKYILRVDNLEDLMSKIEEDISRTVQEMRAIAYQIDRKLRLKE